MLCVQTSWKSITTLYFYAWVEVTCLRDLRKRVLKDLLCLERLWDSVLSIVLHYNCLRGASIIFITDVLNLDSSALIWCLNEVDQRRSYEYLTRGDDKRVTRLVHGSHKTFSKMHRIWKIGRYLSINSQFILLLINRYLY